MLITFEGIDCSGKSTQAKLLVEKLEVVLPGMKGMNPAVRLIREPGGTSVSERIREILLNKDHNELTDAAELFLFSASRSQLVNEVILPALGRGETVVCDRFADSTTAYQGYGRGLDLQTVEVINRLTTSGVKPDLTLFIDIPVNEVERRRACMGSPHDRMEGAGRQFYERVRDGYLKLAREEQERIAVIDGSESIEAVARAVWTLVEPRLLSQKVRSTIVE